MNISLKGKRALVTGGNSGIGAAITIALANAGAKVAINFLVNPEETQKIAAEIKKKQGDTISIQANVSDSSAVDKMFEQIDQEWGGIDILVNNAGIDGKRAMVWEAEIADWRKVIEVNLMGSFYTAQQALKRMIKQKSGVILNVTSVHEIIAWSGYSAYTTSKAALSMMTKTMAQEAAPYGVRVLAIAPGAIKTPINKNVWADPDNLRDLLQKIPLNKLGEPNDIARLVVVFVSDAASYLTGRTVFVDGGMTDYPDFSHGG